MNPKKYFLQFFVLFSFTAVSIFAVWYSLVREESVDWISAQVLHQVSPYAVTTIEDGRVVVDNVVIGYNFSLPAGFKTTGSKNFSFYLEEAGQKKCEIRHYYVKTSQARPGISTAEKTVIPLKGLDLIFELTGPNADKTACADYLKQTEFNLLED